MKISIITVCFNSEKTIEATILSILSQTHKDYEYIIVDGKSTDKTITIINQFHDHFDGNLYVKSEHDKGLYDAMNKGIKMASGEIIGILNSDDVFFSKDILARVSEYHEKNPIIDASIGNIVQINQFGKIIREYSSHNWHPNKLKYGFMPPHPAIFFRKKLFDNFKDYRIDICIAADYELIVRFFLNNKINWGYSNITTTAMLVGGLSSSGSKSYFKISREIILALKLNKIRFSVFLIWFRVVWKIFGFINIRTQYKAIKKVFPIGINK